MYIALLGVYTCSRMEPQIFRCRFAAWNEVLAVDYTQTPEMLERKAIEMVSEDRGPLHGTSDHSLVLYIEIFLCLPL